MGEPRGAKGLGRAGRGEPLGLRVRAVAPPADRPGPRREEFEFSSRGDRVSGRVTRPDGGDGPFPLVLLQHGLGGSARDDDLAAMGERWAESGAAVATIDFPLHGARADQKLLAWLLRGPVDDPRRAALAVEFSRQAVSDLERGLDALATLAWIDPERVAYAGFSLGAQIGCAFCALDPRPRAAALALAGAGLAPPEVDPIRYVSRIAPRPVLFVGAQRDERVPREAANALFEAAGEPKQQLWYDADHTGLPGEALKAIWAFLRRSLDLGG